MAEPFTNEKRNRYYGLRVGDIVACYMGPEQPRINSEVVLLGLGDNNAVFVAGETGPQKQVAEWCNLLIPVEKRTCKYCETLIMPYQKFVHSGTSFRHKDCKKSQHV